MSGPTVLTQSRAGSRAGSGPRAVGGRPRGEWRHRRCGFDGPPLEGPVCISLTFYLPRPKSAPRRVVHPATRPDLSKLVRSVEDALTGIVYRDDAQIMSLTAIKAFATDFVGVAGRVWQQ